MRYLIILAFISFVFKPISSQELNANSEFNLVNSLKLVLNNHKLIEASKIDSKAAEFRLKQSKGSYYPSLDITANYGHERIIKYGPTNDTQLVARDATAKITQTITDFGLRESTVKTSELSLKQSLALEKQIKNDLLLRALTAYLRVIQSRESVKYAVQSVANIKKQTELEDAAVSAGGGLTSDVLQAKTQLAGAQARIIQFEGVLDAAKHEFEYLYGFFPKNLNDLKLTKSIIDQLPKSVEETVVNTMKNNPSLIAARITEDIGKEAINTARSSLFPTIKGILSHSEKQDFGGIVGFKEKAQPKLIFHTL